jgi:hypothetical protein
VFLDFNPAMNQFHEGRPPKSNSDYQIGD